MEDRDKTMILGVEGRSRSEAGPAGTAGGAAR
jgi:hypothetical protein